MSSTQFGSMAGDLADAGEAMLAEVRVPFGKRPNQSVPLSWAETMLTWLYDNRSSVFADAMMAAVGIDKKRRS